MNTHLLATNTHLLATEIVTKIRNSMQDSTLNQAMMVENLIRDAFKQILWRAYIQDPYRDAVAMLREMEMPEPAQHLEQRIESIVDTKQGS
jgi:hypothetical protein